MVLFYQKLSIRVIGLSPLVLKLLGLLGVIVALYISTAEIAKHVFYRLVKM